MAARCTTVVRFDLVSSEKSRSLLARSRSKKRPRRAVTSGGMLFPILDSGKHLSSPRAFLARSPWLSPSFCYESAASGARRLRQQSYIFIYNWPTYTSARAGPPIDEDGTFRLQTARSREVDPVPRDRHGPRARPREWKNGGVRRESAKGVCARKKKSRRVIPQRRESCVASGQLGASTVGRTICFPFLRARRSARSIYARGATGTPGESITPDVQLTFQ